MANRKLAPQAVSFWLETCGDDLSPRPRLKSDITADVAIMGGGFTGLWTAWFLLQHEPSLDIVIVERDFVGHGASGRNGGWVSPRYPVDAHAMIARFGADKARATLLALEDMVESIGTTLAEAGIDAHYRKTGLLTLARGEHQLPGLYATLRTFQRLGLPTTSASCPHPRLLTGSTRPRFMAGWRAMGAGGPSGATGARSCPCARSARRAHL
jgi:glycine/D-amino acid oxidase-like deaminating enzyme